MSASISSLTAATAANDSDVFPVTQGSTGPGTGTTRSVSGAQISALAATHAPVQSVAGRTGGVTLTVSDVAGALPLAGGTMTGALNLAADPIVSAGAATKHYVDIPRGFADRRAPTINDDITGNRYPGSDWVANGRLYMCMANGLGEAIWQAQPNPPLPLDIAPIYVAAAATQAGGTGYAANDTITLPGNAKLKVISQIAGVITNVSFTGAIAGTTLTTSAVTGVLGIGEVILTGAAPGTTITAGSGSSWTVSISQTVSSTAMTATGCSVTTPYAYGWTATANPVTPVATSGGGASATFNLTMKFPFAYSKIRLTSRYTTAGRNSGALMRVANSFSGEYTEIRFIPGTNQYDWEAAVAFAGGPIPMGEYQTYLGGPTPNVMIQYDQGGTTDYAGSNTTDAAPASLATAPIIYPGLCYGRTPPITFAANGSAGGGQPAPSITSLVLPSAVAVSGANAAVIVAGGGIGLNMGFGYLGPSSGTNYFGINGGTLAYSMNANAADSGAQNPAFNVMQSETPAVWAASCSGGHYVLDSTFLPAMLIPFVAFIQSGTVVLGSTAAITVSGGNLSASHTATYTATSGDAAAADPAGVMIFALIAAVNTDATFAKAGITASHSPIFSNYMEVFTPAGTAPSTPWNLSAAGGSGITMSWFVQSTLGSTGGTFAGGVIGKNPYTSYTGLQYQDAFILFPFPLPNIEILHRIRASLDFWLGYTPQYSARVMAVGASNFTALEGPFPIGMTLPSLLPALLGRTDVAIFNPSQAGGEIISFSYAFATWLKPTMLATHCALPQNNITYVQGAYNDFQSTTMTAGISGTTLTVSAQSGGQISKGMVITVGAAVGTTIADSSLTDPTLTGAGGTGTYRVSISQTVSGGTSMTAYGGATSLLNTYQKLTVQAAAAIASGGSVGDTVIASPEPTKNAGNYNGPGGGTMAAQMQAFAAALTPLALGSGAVVVNPQLMAWANLSSTWTPPWYDANDSAGHLALMGTSAVASQVVTVGLSPILQ